MSNNRTVSVYINKPVGTQSVSTYGKRYKIITAGYPFNNSHFTFSPYKNGIPYTTVTKYFVNATTTITAPGTATQSIRNSDSTSTTSLLLDNLILFNITSQDIQFSMSPILNSYNYYDLYMDIIGTLPTDTWTLNTATNSGTGYTLSGPTSLTFSSIEPVYETKRLDLFNDESISVTSQIQNMNDISKVMTDYSQSFTVPASANNNNIFNHWFENAVEDGFDHRIKYDGILEIDNVRFKEGKIALEKANIKNGQVDSYTITFYGNLVNVKDLFKEDKLNILADEPIIKSIYQYWSQSYVRANITSTSYKSIRYPLISSGNSKINGVDGVRKYEYPTATYTPANDITTDAGAIYYKELFPAIEVMKIFRAIESRYDIKFTGLFLSPPTGLSPILSYAWLWCKNAEKLETWSEPSIVHYNVWTNHNLPFAGAYYVPNYINDGSNNGECDNTQNTFRVSWNDWFNTPSYTNKRIRHRIRIQQNGSTNILTAGFLQVYKVVNGAEIFVNQYPLNPTPSPGGSITISSTEVLVYDNYQDQDNTTSYFRYKVISKDTGWSYDAITYLEKSATYNGATVYYQNKSFTSSPVALGVHQWGDSPLNTQMVMRPSKYFPDIKVIDFVIGIVKMFNLTIKPIDDKTFEMLPLDSYYEGGKIYDVTKHITADEFDLTRPKLYNKINFEYEKSPNILNNYFRTNFNREYGDLLYENPGSVDTETYDVKIPFENMMFERTLGKYFITATTYDKDQKPYTPKPVILMANGPQGDGKDINGSIIPMAQPIKLYGDGTSISTMTNYFRFTNEIDLFGDDPSYLYTLNFGNDISPWYLQNAPKSLYQIYYGTYINNLYDLKTRVLNTKAILPISLLNQLNLNDRLQIKDKRYIINSMTTNLTTCEVDFELITDDRITSLPTTSTAKFADYQDLNVTTGKQDLSNIVYVGNNTSMKQLSAQSLDYQSSLYILPGFTFVPTGFTEYSTSTHLITVNPSRWTGSTLKRLNVSIRIYSISSGSPSDEVFYNVRIKRYNPITSITDTFETFDLPNADISGTYILLDTLNGTQCDIAYVYKLEVSISALTNKNLDINGSLSGGVSWYAQLRYEVQNDTYPIGNTFDLDNSSVPYNSLMCSKIENILDCLVSGFTEMQVVDGSTIIVPSATTCNGVAHGGVFSSCSIDVTVDVTTGTTVKVIITENDKIFWVGHSDNSGGYDTGFVSLTPGNTYKVYGMADTESDTYTTTISYVYFYTSGGMPASINNSSTTATYYPLFSWPYTSGWLTQWFNKVSLPVLDTLYYEDTPSTGIIEANIQGQPRISNQVIEYTDSVGNTTNKFISVKQDGYIFNGVYTSGYPYWIVNNLDSVQFTNALSNDINNTFTNTTSTLGTLSTSAQWAGGVLAPNGKIYCAPYNSSTVLVIDPATNTLYNFGSLSFPVKWIGGVLAPNGKIYYAPNDSTTVLVVDPTTDTLSTFGSFTGTGKWAGVVLAPNGKIYCIPSNSSTVLVIDPTTNTTSTFGSLGTGTTKWSGGVLAPNGKIYCIPYSSSTVLVIDPTTNTTSTFGSLSGSNKWNGGVLSSNGNIYCVPFDSTSVLVIDPITNTTSTFGSLSGTNKWYGGALAPNGKIYCAPYNSTSVLVINPFTNTTSTFSSSGIGVSDWIGVVLGYNGKLYFVPRFETYVLVVGGTTISQNMNRVLSRYLNKF